MEFEIGKQVDIIVGGFTKIGIVVLVEEETEGLLYRNEVFQILKEGEKLKGYIKKIREDGKLDISLTPIGFKNSINQYQQLILNKLRLSGGFLPLTDKSDPERIKRDVNMSKKAFKNAVGGLYKLKMILIEENGIKLIRQ